MPDYDTTKWTPVVSAGDAAAPAAGGSAPAFDASKWAPAPPEPMKLGGDSGPGLVQGLKNAGEDLLPHTGSQAALMGAGLAMPVLGEGVGAAEEAGVAIPRMVSQAAQELAAPGIKGAALRTGAMAGVGAATGGQQGAESGALQGVAGEALPPIARKVTGLGKAMAGAMGVTTQDAAEQASQKALENELGMTAEQAQKLAAPKLEQTSGAMGQPEYALRGAQDLAGAKRGMGEGRRAALRGIGQKFDPIYNPVADNPAPPEGIAQIGPKVEEAKGFAAAKGATLSSRTQKYLNDLGQVVAAPPQVMSSGGGAFQLSNAQMAQLQGQGAPVTDQTIGMLRGKLQEGLGIANAAGSSAWDRKAIFDATRPISEMLDNAITPEQRPLLDSVKNEYAQVNRIFPFKNQQALNQAKTLPELGGMLFSKDATPAATMAIPHMNEEQKGMMRKAFAAYILKDADGNPTQALSKLQGSREAVAALYPGSDFGKIATWQKLMVEGRRFAGGPKSLATQREFQEGVKEALKESGFSPEALQAASDALSKGAQNTPRTLRYLTSPWAISGLIGGYGVLGHEPALIVAGAAWAAGHMGWQYIADNPAMLDGYRNLIMSGWTRKGGEAMGRLMVSGLNNALQGAAPELQQTKTVEGPATDALKHSRAEAIAPVPGATDRAKKIMDKMSKGKIPEVHKDLREGRLSMDEVTKMLKQASGKTAMAMLDGVDSSKALDAAEIGSPEERAMLLPLIKQKMMADMKNSQYNRTTAANNAMRYQKLLTSSAEG